jgi:hypothetical protein
LKTTSLKRKLSSKRGRCIVTSKSAWVIWKAMRWNIKASTRISRVKRKDLILHLQLAEAGRAAKVDAAKVHAGREESDQDLDVNCLYQSFGKLHTSKLTENSRHPRQPQTGLRACPPPSTTRVSQSPS